jgi:hypothetical protein
MERTSVRVWVLRCKGDSLDVLLVLRVHPMALKNDVIKWARRGLTPTVEDHGSIGILRVEGLPNPHSLIPSAASQEATVLAPAHAFHLVFMSL